MYAEKFSLYEKMIKNLMRKISNKLYQIKARISRFHMSFSHKIRIKNSYTVLQKPFLTQLKHQCKEKIHKFIVNRYCYKENIFLQRKYIRNGQVWT